MRVLRAINRLGLGFSKGISHFFVGVVEATERVEHAPPYPERHCIRSACMHSSVRSILTPAMPTRCMTDSTNVREVPSS